jgi:hypothetical protein
LLVNQPSLPLALSLVPEGDESVAVSFNNQIDQKLNTNQATSNITVNNNSIIKTTSSKSLSSPSQCVVSPLKFRVLFIGNSLTYFNGGVDSHFCMLARAAIDSAKVRSKHPQPQPKSLSTSSSPPPLQQQQQQPDSEAVIDESDPIVDIGIEDIEVDTCVQGGASLKQLWTKTKAREKIEKNHYDVVVIQEDLPETTVDAFTTYACKFVDLCRRKLARPVLYMTWAYPRLHSCTDDMIEDAHMQVAKQLKVDVGAVSLARRVAELNCPNLSLWDDDNEHPSLAGTFLAACVIFNTIFKCSSESLPYCPVGMCHDDVQLLATIAASVSAPNLSDWCFE